MKKRIASESNIELVGKAFSDGYKYGFNLAVKEIADCLTDECSLIIEKDGKKTKIDDFIGALYDNFYLHDHHLD